MSQKHAQRPPEPVANTRDLHPVSARAKRALLAHRTLAEFLAEKSRTIFEKLFPDLAAFYQPDRILFQDFL